ncbi:putative chitinase [Pseudomonas sp. 58 R 12]|nr:putative chitinase [Pseudomonas sp. 58 R 12]
MISVCFSVPILSSSVFSFARLSRWTCALSGHALALRFHVLAHQAMSSAEVEVLGLDLINQPTLLEQPQYAAMSAAWFWSTKGLNTLADQGDFPKITRRINGGLNGLEDRLQLWERAKKVLA